MADSPWLKQRGGTRTAQPTEPRISPDRKAISERFPQISASPKSPENLDFSAGIALRCRTRLGSLTQHFGTRSLMRSAPRVERLIAPLQLLTGTYPTDLIPNWTTKDHATEAASPM